MGKGLHVKCVGKPQGSVNLFCEVSYEHLQVWDIDTNSQLSANVSSDYVDLHIRVILCKHLLLTQTHKVKYFFRDFIWHRSSQGKPMFCLAIKEDVFFNCCRTIQYFHLTSKYQGYESIFQHYKRALCNCILVLLHYQLCFTMLQIYFLFCIQVSLVFIYSHLWAACHTCWERVRGFYQLMRNKSPQTQLSLLGLV